METTEIKIGLEGVAPIMFDRFIDYSTDPRQPEEKFYLDEGNLLVIPADNIYAFLFGKDVPGAIKTFEDKMEYKKLIQHGEANIYVDPVKIPLLGKDNEPVIWKDFKNDSRFDICMASPRVKKGTSSIKQPARPRPYLKLPWGIEFKITLLDNKFIKPERVKVWFMEGGLTIGLGTYRPRFGRFLISKWEE